MKIGNWKILSFFLILFLTSITSCSSDENESKNDLIIGVWKPIKIVDVCSTGTETINNVSDCVENSRWTFLSNGKLETKDYYDYYFDQNGNETTNSNCEKFNVTNATWEFENNELKIIVNNETLTSDFVEFSGNNLKIGTYNKDSNNTCDGNNSFSHYYIEHERIE